MAYPRLPYWFYVGRVSTPIDGPVYVMKGDSGEVAEQSGSTVLTPRLKFFASKQAVSHLVSRGLVKRMKQPEPPKEEVATADLPQREEAAPAPAPATKSEPEPAPEQPKADDVSGGSGTGSEGAVVASDAGEGEAGGSSSEPEEKETAKSGRRRPRRS